MYDSYFAGDAVSGFLISYHPFILAFIIFMYSCFLSSRFQGFLFKTDASVSSYILFPNNEGFSF
jgi:hypothetical protein